jgi:hypothetical protein
MPPGPNSSRRVRRAMERENKVTLPTTMKALLPFLLAVLAPFRKLLRGLLDKHVSPVIRHGLTVAAGWLGARGLIDDEQAVRIVELNDVILSVFFGALALAWSYAEKKLGAEKIKSAVSGAVPLVLATLAIAALLPACEATKNAGASIGNRVKALGLGVRCTITGEEVCICAGKQDAGDPAPAVVVPAK